ncbi:hypothetical protein [Maricaulis salignorans]|uniref:Uncharacterized protein n=1 Tax=Maricaulis salignorans TaxID=144026 RepID=A0A1G9SA56_9PROT|nr:hypothetical protein [Maricaulis salignorans]SDM32344.1 hypothetical protein SAMN04488568_10918 [Maricaulis salignorans]
MSDTELRSNPAQARLLNAAQTLQTSYRDNAWVRTDGAMQTARGWMDRLTGQAGNEAEPVAQPGQAYIELRQLLTLNAADAAELVVTDVTLATAQARQVDQAARAIIIQPAGFTRSTLTRDLGEVETAISLTREAVTTFDAVVVVMSDRFDEDQRARVNIERDQLAFLSESLRDRADALARLRREIRDVQPFS